MPDDIETRHRDYLVSVFKYWFLKLCENCDLKSIVKKKSILSSHNAKNNNNNN